jgi:hypothetical protein
MKKAFIEHIKYAIAIEQSNKNKSEKIANNDILNEDYEIPVCNQDLQETIEQGIDIYNQMPFPRKETKYFRNKINELIDEYNGRRQMHIYNHI